MSKRKKRLLPISRKRYLSSLGYKFCKTCGCAWLAAVLYCPECLATLNKLGRGGK